MNNKTVYEFWQEFNDVALPLGMPQKERDIQRVAFYVGTAAGMLLSNVDRGSEVPLNQILNAQTLELKMELDRAIFHRQYGPQEDERT